MATLTARIEEQLHARSAAPALLWNDEVLTFAQLDAWSVRIANALHARGVGAGERVAVGLPNSPALIATVIGVLRARAVLVPLNPAYTAAEAIYIVNDAAAALIITHDEQARALRAGGIGAPIVSQIEGDATAPSSVSPNPDDAALIVYTSGTTGSPKGAVLSQRALLTNLLTVSTAWRWTAADRLLLTLPCFHLHGLALGILGSLVVGSSIVLRPRFVAEEVPALLASAQCTTFFGVPTMYNRLVTLAQEVVDSHDPRRMRLWVSGSAPLTAATFTRFRERFGHEILERFGMSEGGFMIAVPYDGPRRPGVVGKALPGIDVRVIDPDAADRGTIAAPSPDQPGEIVIRGPNLFSGYWRRPEETRQAFIDEYFRSGDLAVVESDGMIRIVGRRSVDIIKSRGFKISAVEIENCLQAHPAVAEVAVVGVPDTDQGEVVTAVITTIPGTTLSAEEVRAHTRAHLAPHKVPGRVVFLDEIPRTGPGKFKKRELIERLKGKTES
jgi:malonyl-CoA/methylmalonyl-CoA synthetase